MSRSLSPARDFPVFLLLGDPPNAVSPSSYCSHEKEDQGECANHTANGVLRWVTPPARLVPPWYPTAVVVYGTVMDKGVCSRSVPAMCPVSVREERAGCLLNAVVVADGRWPEVPVRTMNWTSALEVLYVAVLVLVVRMAAAGEQDAFLSAVCAFSEMIPPRTPRQCSSPLLFAIH